MFCQWVESIYTFINVLASNYAIKLVNTGNSTCHSTLDRWTIGNKSQGLNRRRTRLHAGLKIIYRKQTPQASIRINTVLTYIHIHIRTHTCNTHTHTYTQTHTYIPGTHSTVAMMCTHCWVLAVLTTYSCLVLSNCSCHSDHYPMHGNMTNNKVTLLTLARWNLYIMITQVQRFSCHMYTHTAGNFWGTRKFNRFWK